jgi:hypothetical protein
LAPFSQLVGRRTRSFNSIQRNGPFFSIVLQFYSDEIESGFPKASGASTPRRTDSAVVNRALGFIRPTFDPRYGRRLLLGPFVGTIYQINRDINNYQEGNNNTNDLAYGKSRFTFPAFVGFNPSPPAAVFATISPLVEEFQEVLVQASGVAASESR